MAKRNSFILILCYQLFLHECFGKIRQNPIYGDAFIGDNSKQAKNAYEHYHGDQNQAEKKSVGGALLALGVLSAGFDIYKQEAGCKPTNPKLFSNVKKASKMQEEAMEMRKQINLDWTPINAAEGYIQKLGGEMVILREHIARIDLLKFDIVQLLDIHIYTKMDLAKTEIENDILVLNQTEYMNPDVLVQKFYSQASYALALTFKLGPVAIWLGSKTIGPYITKAFSKAIASEWVAKHNNVVTKMIRNYKANGLFPTLRLRWNQFVTKSPIIQGIKSKLTFSTKTQLRLTKIKTGIATFGKFAITGLFAAYEIYNGIKFFKECNAKEKESEYLLNNVTESLTNLTLLSEGMQELKTEIYENYGTLHTNLASTPFIELLQDIYEMVVSAQFQNETSKTIAQNIKFYITEINSGKTGENDYDLAKVETLIKTLNSALLMTSYQLECYRRKLAIIASVAKDCADGVAESATLWTKAKALEGQTLENCITEQNYLSEESVLATVGGFMDTQGKSPLCLRNDPQRLTVVCIAWHRYESQADISKSTNLGLDDVTYFVGICPPGDITADMEAAICYDKEQNHTDTYIINKYSRHNITQIKSFYKNQCNLTSRQQSTICTLKSTYKTLAEVQAHFYSYDGIEPVYNACLPNVQLLCLFSEYISFGNATHVVHANDVKFYGIDVVENIIKNQC